MYRRPDGRRFADNTVITYLLSVKPFLNWLHENGYAQFPPKQIREIKVPAIRTDTTRPDEILTYEEILALIRACRNSRDRAFIGTLYESGCRIGELARARWRDMVFDEYGVKFYIWDEKTDKYRYSRLTMAREYLAAWRNDTIRKGPDDHIFVSLRSKKPINYMTVRGILERLKAASGIKKRLNPHIFRKSRITHMIAQGFQESVVKQSMWGNLNTDMFRTYVCLGEDQIDDEFLARSGMKREHVAENPLAPVLCPECHRPNPPESAYCNKCSTPLTEKAAASRDQAVRIARDTPEYQRLLEQLRADLQRSS
ncbi:MAG: site-specific integrase [Methanomicrobiales archaeon]|nr:site-specific integrase [Methanomicrobiales archaeon]